MLAWRFQAPLAPLQLRVTLVSPHGDTHTVLALLSSSTQFPLGLGQNSKL